MKRIIICLLIAGLLCACGCRAVKDNPALQSLFDRERALVDRYAALPGELTVEMYGRHWTGDEILSDPTLDGEAFDALYEAYMALFNAEAAAIFIELLKVRRAIADAHGFSFYAEFAYVHDRRAYTHAQAALLSDRVREAALPQLNDLQTDFYLAAARLYGLYADPAPTLARTGAAIAALLPELGKRWDEMIRTGRYRLETDPKRITESSINGGIADGEPLLSIDWTGAFDMPAVLAHAFGRYVSTLRSGDGGDGGNPRDLAEIDAQGLELLTVLQYDTIYGDISDAAETAELFFALYTLIDGCAADAFERYAYAQAHPTVEDLNAAYGRIAEAFGLSALGAEARAWTRNPHLFGTPFSGIGRTVGAIAALELFLKGTRDPSAAAEAYRAVLDRTGGTALFDALRAAGLSDPLEAETVERLMRDLAAYRGRQE